MATTDQAVLTEAQYHLIETVDSGATWGSGQWTVAEVIALLNNRQYQFLKETGVVLARGTISTLPFVNRHTLPSDWVATRRMVWFDGTDYSEVPADDSWDADHMIAGWPNTAEAKPQAYGEGETPTLEVQTFPAANTPGQLQLLYVALSTALSNSGVSFTVPDEFVPAIKWGTIGDMLSKTGRAIDPGRAAYCMQRYQEGVEAARLILMGFV